jgi:hypothetical protein
MKKRVLSILAAVALLCGCLMIPGSAAAKPANLKFRGNGTFKIIQVSDLQEAYITSTITQQFLLDVAKTERPDLFVLTGDNIADAAIRNANTQFLRRSLVNSSINSFMNVFDIIYWKYGIPVTMVFGNHDAEAQGITRKAQFAMYAAHPSFIGVATEADNGTTGKNGPHYGTHNLVICDRAGKTPVFNLWMFDTGDYRDGSDYDGVQQPQIDWFNRTNQALGRLPSLAFQHIIVPEIYDFLKPGNDYSKEFYQYDGQGYGTEHLVTQGGNPVKITKSVSKILPTGTQGAVNEAPCPGRFNEGEYTALSAGNVLALFTGHDHVNTFELRLSGTDLVNTPIGSWGSYGQKELRGLRVITLNDSNLNNYSTNLITYRGYYGDDAFHNARLDLFDKYRTWISILDVFSFLPVQWVIGLIKR